jgi:hypothetical protein
VNVQVASRELAEDGEHMFEVIFEHIGVELSRDVECSDRTAGGRAPDTGLSSKKITPADDTNGVDIAWATPVGILESDEPFDEYFERDGSLSGPTERLSVCIASLNVSAKEFGQQAEVRLGEETHAAHE